MSNTKEVHSKPRLHVSLSTCYYEYGPHVGRLHCRRRRAYAPTSNTASPDNHEKINSWVFFFVSHIRVVYGAPLGGPSGRRSSAITLPNYSGAPVAQGPPSGAQYSYGKQKETHELIFMVIMASGVARGRVRTTKMRPPTGLKNR